MAINASIARARYGARQNPLLAPEHQGLGDVAFYIDDVTVYMAADDVRAMLADLTGVLAEFDAGAAPASPAVVVDTDTGEVLTEPMKPADAAFVANATTVVGRRVHVQAVAA